MAERTKQVHIEESFRASISPNKDMLWASVLPSTGAHIESASILQIFPGGARPRTPTFHRSYYATLLQLNHLLRAVFALG